MRWMDAEDRFAETLDGFQPRENQRALALEIENALDSFSHLMAQAGCGTGKSFAGTVPAINHSKKTGKPVVYATATKALQDQLANKDLPFLKTVLGDFEFAVLKGRSNYVCLQKLDEWDDYAKSDVQKLVMAPDFSGEVVDLPHGSTVASQITTTSEECPGKRSCPFGEVCFAERAKKKAKDANLIVINHAVLASDLSIKASQVAMGIPADKATAILPQFSGVVVDEAHEMEEYVTSSLGETVTAGSFGRLGTEIANFLGGRDAAREMIEKSEAVFNVVRRELAKHRRQRGHERDRTAPFTADTLNALSDPVFDLINTLVALNGKVVGTQIYNDDKKVQKRVRLNKRMENLVEKLRYMMTADFTQLVRWMTVAEGKRGETIEWAPLTISDFLRKNLWTGVPGVLMSATLALGSDFSFLAERLGIDEYEGFDAGTPFDFKVQARTFVPQIAAPVAATKEKWRASAIAMTGELVQASDGRALFLYTSKAELEEAHIRLAPLIQRMGHRVLKQGERPNKELAREFKEDEHSVLFATKSFFTGIDIQGDSLRLVVIDKLPFPVPSDVIFKARCDAIDKGGNPFSNGGSFWKLTVPSMALSILQAYGRLIRTVHDSGMVAIMDSRLYGREAKNYGSKIMTALPEAPVITNLTEAVSYLEGLNS
jgi:ATP-dependent DNA helicase DinG